MIDSFTKKPIRVSDDGDDGDADPYIMVQLHQLDQVKKPWREVDQPPLPRHVLEAK